MVPDVVGSVFDEAHLQGGSMPVAGDISQEGRFIGHNTKKLIFTEGGSIDIKKSRSHTGSYCSAA